MGKNAFALFLSLVCLAACAMPQRNISSDYQLNDKAGVVLMSLTASGDCGFAYFAVIRRVLDKKEYSVGMQDIGEQRDWEKQGNCPTQADDYFGKLAVLALPAGEYEFITLEGVSRYRAVVTEDLGIKFSVAAGKFSYLGNIHFHFRGDVFDYEAKDMRDRDITRFLRKYDQVDLGDILIRVIRFVNSE